MDFSAKHEKLIKARVALDATCEQTVQLDFILPDYYPDIFRILKCRLIPQITSKSQNGSALTFDMTVRLFVLYRSAENKKINVISQSQSFTKTLDIEDNISCDEIILQPRCDYVNCRVLNQRRIDIRGCASVKAKAYCYESNSLLTDASGSGIKLKRQKVQTPTKRLNTFKTITLSEDIELSEQKPDVDSLISATADVKVTETAVISGKVAVKGEADISVLYNTDDEKCETLNFTVPFSNVLEVSGIDDSYKLCFDITSEKAEIISKSGSKREFSCEVSFCAELDAVKYSDIDVVSDAYSTRYECTPEFSNALFETTPSKSNITFDTACSLKNNDGDISQVICINAECINVQYKTDNGKLTVIGSVCYESLTRDSDGYPTMLEGTANFEKETDDDVENAFDINLSTKVQSCSYSIKSENEIEATASISIEITIRKSLSCQAMTDIKLSSESAALIDDRCAVKLYSAENGETIWDIAKKFHTSEEAILEENEAAREKAENLGLLLIPIAD